MLIKTKYFAQRKNATCSSIFFSVTFMIFSLASLKKLCISQFFLTLFSIVGESKKPPSPTPSKFSSATSTKIGVNLQGPNY